MRLLICLVLVALAIQEAAPCALFCYYVPSARTKHEAQLTPEKLPSPMPCSHLVYGFASIDSEHQIVPTNVNDLPTLATTGNYQKINNLKMQNPQLRTMLAVRKQGRFPAMSNKFTRTALAQSAINHLRSNHLDGLVLHTDANEMNSNSFIHLLNVMKLEFDREAEKSQMRRLQLVVAVPAKDIQRLSNVLSKIAEQVDFIYLIAHITPASADRNKVAYVDPLYPTIDVEPEDTVNYNVKQLVSSGAPKEKVVVGLTMWGHSYILANKQVNTHGAPASDFGYPGKYTDSRGRLAYFELCEEKETDFGDFPILEDSHAIATSFKGRLNQWFAFNEPGEIYKKKVEWITSQSLGGIGVYSLDADDFFGTCMQGEFPLLRATAANMKCNPGSEHTMMTGQDIPIVPVRMDHSDTEAAFDTDPETNDNRQQQNPPKSCIRNCYHRPQVDSSFDFTSLDGSWCSHLTISSLRFNPEGKIQVSPSVALALEKYHAWHPMNPKPQLIFAVGGEQSGGQWRSVLQNDERRQTLIQEIERLLTTNGARGVDISWTTDSLDSISDRNIHGQLVNEIRARLRPSLAVIISVTPDSAYTDRYDYSAI
uniref:GH18 domain-containing protein n=1 Tax=Plectus sambesii TaxID=2011161 RepID=A0A914VEY3_9BILA